MIASAVSGALAGTVAFAGSGGEPCANAIEAVKRIPTSGHSRIGTPLLMRLRKRLRESSFGLPTAITAARSHPTK